MPYNLAVTPSQRHPDIFGPRSRPLVKSLCIDAAMIRGQFDRPHDGRGATIPAGAPMREIARSEFVTQTGAHGVDVGVDLGCEADIFPLRTQEQAADQIDIDTEAGRVAIDQVIVHGIVCGQGQ